MDRKFVLVFVLFVVLATVCFVSASETVEIADMKFNVPDGYTKDSDMEVDDYLYRYTFTNGNENYTISVLKDKDQVSEDKNAPFSFYTETTINGKDGYLKEIDSGVSFIYLENGSSVSINAPNKELIEEIIIE